MAKKKKTKKSGKIPKVVIVGASPENEYGWKDQNEKPQEEPAVGSAEHIKKWLEQNEKEKQLEKEKTLDKLNIYKHLEIKANGGEKTLRFDPITGELLIGAPSPNDDSVVVDQIYKDGFFCDKAA